MRRGLLAAAGVAALVWAAVAIADVIDCNGGGKQCNGTPFDDEITGSSKADGIKAKGGNDETIAGNGKDVVEGGAGNDYVEGGKGDDKISGGDDSDQFLIGGLWGGPGDDTIEGGDGADDVHGGSGQGRPGRRAWRRPARRRRREPQERQGAAGAHQGQVELRAGVRHGDRRLQGQGPDDCEDMVLE